MGSVVEVIEVRCHRCLALFFICQPCFRGHGYCADECREVARREQRRAANARHQRTEEGRDDHRERQRDFRNRRRERSRVTDQGSAICPADSTVPPADTSVGERSDPDAQSETVQGDIDRSPASAEPKEQAGDTRLAVVIERADVTRSPRAGRVLRSRYCGIAGTHVVTSGLHGFRSRRGPAPARLRGG